MSNLSLQIERSFEPVSLVALEQAASLLTRVDRKYVVNREQALDAVHALRGDTKILRIDAAEVFSYRSRYYDTADLQLYKETATGRRRRAKVRVRTYHDGQSMVEVKRRDSRDNTEKIRMALASDTPSFSPEVRDFVDATLQRSDFASRLQPTVETHYFRTTLLDPTEHARCTIDSALRFTAIGNSFDVGDDPVRNSAPFGDVVIIETKSLGRATDMDRVLWGQRIRPCAISKFAAAVALLYPNVAHNRWHRVLHQHFMDQRVQAEASG